MPAESSREIDGSATLTMVVSRLMASTAAQTVARTAALWGRPVERMVSIEASEEVRESMWTVTT